MKPNKEPCNKCSVINNKIRCAVCIYGGPKEISSTLYLFPLVNNFREKTDGKV